MMIIVFVQTGLLNSVEVVQIGCDCWPHEVSISAAASVCNYVFCQIVVLQYELMHTQSCVDRLIYDLCKTGIIVCPMLCMDRI